MKIKNAILGMAALGSLAVLSAPSQAQDQSTFASVTGSGVTRNMAFTYTGGVGGGVMITPGAQFRSEFLPTSDTVFPVTFNVIGLQNVGTVTGGILGMDGTLSPYNQQLSGGSFSIISDATGENLLSATFSDGDLLTGTSGASTTSITNKFNNVIYNGGTYFAQSGLFNPGSFSLSMTSVTPAVSSNGSYLNDFQAAGTGTFSASTVPPAVPEPASAIPFAMGGLGLLALGLRARKARRTVGAAA